MGRALRLAARAERAYPGVMKVLAAAAAFSVCSSLVSHAFAQDEDPEAAVAHRAPPARRGFQMALRSGVSLPFGKVDGDADLKMSDLVAPQVPLIIDIGGKPIKQLFLGAYVGVGAGAVAGETDDWCDRENLDCIALSLQAGVQVQYHILPHEDLNPWIGYGLGLESVIIGITHGDEDGSLSFGGFQFARFMGGVDFRINRTLGIGPFVDFALGQYGGYRYDAPVITDDEGDYDDKKLHEWLTIGARFVFFP